MRIILAFFLAFIGLAFTVGSINDLKAMSGWWPETLHPRVIDINKIDFKQASQPTRDWWLIKGGTPRFDLETTSHTDWKQAGGVTTSLTEFYYIPFSTCPTQPVDDIKLVIAMDAETYHKLRQSDDPFAFDRPHGLISVAEYTNPNIKIKPPFFLMSFEKTPEQPENPWIGLVVGILLLAATIGLGVWKYYRP